MNYVELLDATLENAVKKSISNVEHIGILFSSGLDSSLLAKICEDFEADATLYSAAMKDSVDFDRINSARNFFKSEIKLRELQLGDIEKYAAKVIEIIKNTKPLHVSIGIPFCAACEEAQKNGERVILIGQGADELFAGYHRYLGMDTQVLKKALIEDFEKLKRIDFYRDKAIAEAHGMELKLPYLDEDVVRVAFQIPVELKIKNGIRKYILREVARKRSLPEAICTADKKAVQFSSGVDKVLRRCYHG